MAEEIGAVIEITISLVTDPDTWWGWVRGKKTVMWQKVYGPWTMAKICELVKSDDVVCMYMGSGNVPILLGGSILIERRVIE